MEGERRQPWLLIGTAVLALGLGVLALVVALNAKSASDDAADQAAVARTDAKLTRLITHLGVTEQSLSGEQGSLSEEIRRDERQSSDAADGLAKRVDTLEREVKELESSAGQNANANKRIAALEADIEAINTRIAALNRRMAQLVQRTAGG